MVKLNKNGGPKNPEKVDRLCALFTVGPTTVIATAKKNIGLHMKILILKIKETK